MKEFLLASIENINAAQETASEDQYEKLEEIRFQIQDILDEIEEA